MNRLHCFQWHVASHATQPTVDQTWSYSKSNRWYVCLGKWWWHFSYSLLLIRREAVNPSIMILYSLTPAMKRHLRAMLFQKAAQPIPADILVDSPHWIEFQHEAKFESVWATERKRHSNNQAQAVGIYLPLMIFDKSATFVEGWTWTVRFSSQVWSYKCSLNVHLYIKQAHQPVEDRGSQRTASLQHISLLPMSYTECATNSEVVGHLLFRKVHGFHPGQNVSSSLSTSLTFLTSNGKQWTHKYDPLLKTCWTYKRETFCAAQCRQSGYDLDLPYVSLLHNCST